MQRSGHRSGGCVRHTWNSNKMPIKLIPITSIPPQWGCLMMPSQPCDTTKAVEWRTPEGFTVGLRGLRGRVFPFYLPQSSPLSDTDVVPLQSVSEETRPGIKMWKQWTDTQSWIVSKTNTYVVKESKHNKRGTEKTQHRLRKLNVELPCDPAMPPVVLYPTEETTDTCTPMFM